MDQQRVGFFPQPRRGEPALGAEPIEFLLCARPQCTSLLPVPAGLSKFVLIGLPVRLNIAEHAIDGHDLRPEQVAGPFHDLGIESQTFCDR